jgi:hypothetical protein
MGLPPGCEIQANRQDPRAPQLTCRGAGTVPALSNSRVRNALGVRYWFALTPTLSQAWEREQETEIPLRLPFSQNWEKGLGDEG